MKIMWCLMITVFFCWLAVYAYRSEPHSEVLQVEPQLSALMDKAIAESEQTRPVVLHPMVKTTMLAELYPDYANDKNPKSLPNDWDFKKGRKR